MNDWFKNRNKSPEEIIYKCEYISYGLIVFQDKNIPNLEITDEMEDITFDILIPKHLNYWNRINKLKNILK